MPNITGAFSQDQLTENGNSGLIEIGALYNYGRSSATSTSGGQDGNSNAIGIDASRGETKTDGTLKTDDEHKTYGSSDYVTPKNMTTKLWKRIN